MTRHRSDRPDMILRFIARYTDENERPPSVREIGAAVGLSSTAAVTYRLDQLVKQGLLRHAPFRGYNLPPEHDVTADALELAWCLSVHGSKPPKVRPCKRHRVMAEWLVEIVLPRARDLAA